jgi:hypothetical protein
MVAPVTIAVSTGSLAIPNIMMRQRVAIVEAITSQSEDRERMVLVEQIFLEIKRALGRSSESAVAISKFDSIFRKPVAGLKKWILRKHRAVLCEE